MRTDLRKTLAGMLGTLVSTTLQRVHAYLSHSFSSFATDPTRLGAVLATCMLSLRLGLLARFHIARSRPWRHVRRSLQLLGG